MKHLFTGLVCRFNSRSGCHAESLQRHVVRRKSSAHGIRQPAAAATLRRVHENGRFDAGHPHVVTDGSFHQLRLRSLRLPPQPPPTATTTATTAATTTAAATTATTDNPPTPDVASGVASGIDSVFLNEPDAAAAAGHVVQRTGRQHVSIDAITSAIRSVTSGQLRWITSTTSGPKRSHFADERKSAVSTDVTDAHRRHAGSCSAAGHCRKLKRKRLRI